MGKFDKLISKMRDNPANVRYRELKSLCERFFGPPRQESGSHAVFKMPWKGDPRVNIQADKNGKAKIYQIKQALIAIDRLLEEGEERSSK
jgi:hypothetical protein